ncbi:MAG: hypothetical protein CM1200mP3_12680 [Chloroflexota bacterium]|nr:MAG: hypothetical protein CM1200mP3_12680 [Chloroflexota bacterium]
MQYLCFVTNIGVQICPVVGLPGNCVTGIVQLWEWDKRTVRRGPCALPGE